MVSIFGDGAKVQDHAETLSRGGRLGLVGAIRGKLELVAMAGVLGAVACSCTTMVVAVKLVVVLATSPYSDD